MLTLLESTLETILIAGSPAEHVRRLIINEYSVLCVAVLDGSHHLLDKFFPQSTPFGGLNIVLCGLPAHPFGSRYMLVEEAHTFGSAFLSV